MALFGGITRNPALRGLLYGVDEAQIFRPVQRRALSLASGMQGDDAGAREWARHDRCDPGAARHPQSGRLERHAQFFGRQSAPAVIEAARNILAADGG